VAPSTTAVLPDLGNSKALKFTVEPGSGSTQPTGQVVAELPLV
jgi:anti-sigma-K factor RskA